MMKRYLASAFMLGVSIFGYAQVGVNTYTPIFTLDIVTKNTTGASKNVDGLLVPKVDRHRALSKISIPVSTLKLHNYLKHSSFS